MDDTHRRPSTGIQSISAITLAVSDMLRSVQFYRALGFKLLYGGEDADFTSFSVGGGYLNIMTQPGGIKPSFWGRVIFYVEDVDAMYDHVIAEGLQPEAEPRDAEWHERYFHIRDPDGHELSFAKPLT